MLEMKRESCESIDQHISSDYSKGRQITRTVEVFDDLSCINQNYWKGIQSFVCVTRRGLRRGKAYYERVYYISSLLISAQEFGQRIREHWLIENQNHWVRDVLFREDSCKICSGFAAQNFAIIISIVLNLLRISGYHSPTTTQRMIADNINYLLLFCT
jgi:predicted transposase YbfD/YdcC